MSRRETAGLEPLPKKIKPTNRTFNEMDEFGELGDLWATTNVVRSKDFHEY